MDMMFLRDLFAALVEQHVRFAFAPRKRRASSEHCPAYNSRPEIEAV
jgi:hypothetical protein